VDNSSSKEVYKNLLDFCSPFVEDIICNPGNLIYNHLDNRCAWSRSPSSLPADLKPDTVWAFHSNPQRSAVPWMAELCI